MDLRKLSAHAKNLPASGLTLELKRVPSFIIAVYLLFGLLIVTACYISLPNFGLFLCTILVIVAYGQFILRKSLLRKHQTAIKYLVFTELGWCYVQLNNDKIFKADIDVDSILTEHLIILNFNEHSAVSIFSSIFNHYSVLLTASELGDENFRKVKRHLRLINFSKK
ncbi:MAG: hypothetical protein KZQ64_01595 [gamma proteobacterium symbiont of Bathyaustriella thionipta]|nr:hypothetical protein [gamma proteobacterium symbiont of Bathyaustriella thionipta]MCU7950483.1 hypothetical protein [gamma proteobacterium symbiont of Bathyaustriella thionipta]MCU7952090.1 hypothetical protein [gamma proteobacterium symbiont of Bathyaustriella thionipta]MCU7956984.1 hypothetical protein [gamma proteobacterium symbiont of Bathyaustriella thionipta]MCU7967081.1 hypothetical protein [gamma proteobacterium symbiont of Bathyaustriella thionipta]